MRALYIAFDVFPRAKGSSTHIASMVAALEQTFGAVELLCLGTPDMPAFQQEGHIEIRRFRERHRNLPARATAFARFVHHRVRALAGQLSLAVFRDPWGGFPLLRAQPRCPAIFEVNALPTWELSYSRPAFASNHALRAKLGDLERRCLRDAARILCVSSVTRDALIRLGADPAKIAVIPNEARDVFFTPPAVPSPIPALAHGDWFGYIGGLQPWQGLDALIDAYALVAPDHPDSRLLILHSGQDRALRPVQRAVARRHLEDRVLLHPPLPPDGVAAVLTRLRFTVVPLADTPRNTLQGCCPLKMIESMAAATPVIASDLAVVREWVRDGVEGVLAPPAATRDWALALDRMLRHHLLRNRLSQGARRRAAECFAPVLIRRRLEDQFRSVAEGPA
ncbi:MAG: glycosyltransferase family 4 protein [Bryobacteraceae bacterium]|nr:glycosyltransferase family 4 protein [Bryobacteraceae bacterium]